MRRTPNRRTPALLLALLLACFAGGCMQVEDRLRIAADGSAAVTITVRTTASLQQLIMGRQMARMHGGEAPPSFPPLSAQEAKQLFPGDGVERAFEPGRDGETTTCTTTVRFPDLASLLASPYAARHQLRLARDPEQGLVVHAVDALQEAVALVGLEAEDPLFARMPVDKELVVAQRDAFVSTFILELPGPVSAETASSVEANTATWTAAFTDADFRDRLLAVRRASCPAAAITAAVPSAPARLGSHTFADLSEGASTSAEPVDTQAILAAAEFIPVEMVTTRSFDLSGEGHGNENGIIITGVVQVPRAFEPQRWGQTAVTLARSDRGDDLTRGSRNSHRSYFHGGMDDSEPEQVHHQVQLNLGLPPLAARSLERVEAQVAAFYPSGARVIKLPAAIPAASIREGDLFSWSSSDNLGIAHPVLDELGAGLELEQGARSSGLLQLRFELNGERVAVEAAQVYDRDGQPCPGMQMQRHGNLQLLVAGQPQPPLSLALRLKVSGEPVQIPIALSDVPLPGADAGGGDALPPDALPGDELPPDALPDDAIPLEEALP